MTTFLCYIPDQLVVLCLLVLVNRVQFAYGLSNHHHPSDRRSFFAESTQKTTAAALLAGSSSSLLIKHPRVSLAAETTLTGPKAGGLATQLAKKDPSALKNKIFNIPPSLQTYPSWMEGTWKITSRFAGYLFPSKTIPKDQILQDFVVPGFQKCSIAATADVGKEQVQYDMRIIPTNNNNNKKEPLFVEDRSFNFQSSINAYLGYGAVQQVLYDGSKNPNRLGIDFVDYRTINAERIELFCNARESESYSIPTTTTTTTNDASTTNDNSSNNTYQRIFVASEHVKQVTFGTGSTQGVPRQVGTNYGLYWTWKDQGPNRISGNLLVAGYLDPQDSLYFQEPTDPVVVYSHQLSGVRI